MMPYIRRFTKLAYQQYKQIFLQFMLNFYLKSCVRYIKEMQQFFMYSVKKKKLKESPSFKTWRVFRMLLAFRNPGEHQLTDE